MFSGPFAWAAAGFGGFHCANITAELDLEATGTGTVTSFDTNEGTTTNCTTTPDNFVVHTTATGLPWTIHTDGHDTMEITGVDLLTEITHPATPHLVIALRELTGDFHATIPGGQTNDIEELTLSGEGQMHLFPGTITSTISGGLERTTETQVGTATVNTD